MYSRNNNNQSRRSAAESSELANQMASILRDNPSIAEANPELNERLNNTNTNVSVNLNSNTNTGITQTQTESVTRVESIHSNCKLRQDLKDLELMQQKKNSYYQNNETIESQSEIIRPETTESQSEIIRPEIETASMIHQQRIIELNLPRELEIELLKALKNKERLTRNQPQIREIAQEVQENNNQTVQDIAEHRIQAAEFQERSDVLITASENQITYLQTLTNFNVHHILIGTATVVCVGTTGFLIYRYFKTTRYMIPESSIVPESAALDRRRFIESTTISDYIILKIYEKIKRIIDKLEK